MQSGTIAGRSRLIVLPLIVWLLFFGAMTAGAQTDAPTPLTIGEIQVGEIAEPGMQLTFIVPVVAPQTLDVDVFAITAGLTPTFRIVDASGVVLHIALNAGDQQAVQARAVPVNAGIHFIEVSSLSNTTGQILISVQSGVPLQPPQPLALGQVRDGQVNSGQPLQTYAFTGLPTGALALTVYGMDLMPSLLVTLKDAATAETLAMSTARVSGLRYRIASGSGDYLLEVASGSPAVPQNYVICLEADAGPSICPVGQAVVPPTPTPRPLPTIAPPTPTPAPTEIVLETLSPLGPCVVASSTGGRVNIRSGPSTTFPVIGQITGNTTAPVIGRLPDNTWYQVSPAGLVGWISATVVRLGGQCGGVPSVTLTPTPTSFVPPSATPFAPTATPTLTPTDPATLNFSLPPNFGSQSLTAGFVPDPFTVNITSGGPVNVSYLGGGCTGWATSAPDFSVNYTAGVFPLLRFYFIGAGDTTMVIRTPGGSYVCNDDSFGTLHPTIDFNAPASGRYDVWIGSFAEGAFHAGMLHVTENSGNHP